MALPIQDEKMADMEPTEPHYHHKLGEVDLNLTEPKTGQSVASAEMIHLYI